MQCAKKGCPQNAETRLARDTDTTTPTLKMTMNSQSPDESGIGSNVTHPHAHASGTASVRSPQRGVGDAFVEDFPQQAYDEWTMRFTAQS